MRSVLIALGFLLAGNSILYAQEVNFDDLRRPGKPLVKTYSIKGAGIEGANAISKYSDVDTHRVAQSKEARTTAAANANAYCASSDTCFEILSSSKGEVKIRCVKGLQYKIGKTYEICGPNGRGKWASGCGISDSFAHHYTFKEAGNYNCK